MNFAPLVQRIDVEVDVLDEGACVVMTTDDWEVEKGDVLQIDGLWALVRDVKASSPTERELTLRGFSTSESTAQVTMVYRGLELPAPLSPGSGVDFHVRIRAPEVHPTFDDELGPPFPLVLPATRSGRTLSITVTNDGWVTDTDARGCVLVLLPQPADEMDMLVRVKLHGEVQLEAADGLWVQ